MATPLSDSARLALLASRRGEGTAHCHLRADARTQTHARRRSWRRSWRRAAVRRTRRRGCPAAGRGHARRSCGPRQLGRRRAVPFRRRPGNVRRPSHAWCGSASSAAGTCRRPVLSYVSRAPATSGTARTLTAPRRPHGRDAPPPIGSVTSCRSRPWGRRESREWPRRLSCVPTLYRGRLGPGHRGTHIAADPHPPWLDSRIWPAVFTNAEKRISPAVAQHTTGGCAD